MKKLYILLITLVIVNGAMAQWFPQNSGTNHWLRSVFFTDDNTGYIVGDSGTILKTTNGGDQWFPLNSSTNKDLWSVDFHNSSTGYAVGKGVILKTTDAGANWINQTPSTMTEFVWLNDISFPSTDTVFIVGDSVGGISWSTGIIFKSYNGGTTWTTDTLIYDPIYATLRSVHFLNCEVGFACGYLGANGAYNGLILKTTNGGLDWSDNIVGPALKTIFFTNDTTGHCVGGFNMSAGSQEYKTTDAGSTWIPGNEFTFHPFQIFFPDINTGIIAGTDGNTGDGSILKTTNGGATWSQPINIDSSNVLNSVFFTDILTGYVVGSGGVIYKTTNGGYPLGENDQHQATRTLTIYPNPTSATITIETSAKGTLSIHNVSCQQLLQQSVTAPVTTIDVSGWKSGVYVVKVVGEQGVSVGKFVKE